MPLYEFDCRGCKHRFETLVRRNDTPACPTCQSRDLERVLSVFAVSSESTRQAALSHGRRLLSREQRDKAIAEREAFEHHHH